MSSSQITPTQTALVGRFTRSLLLSAAVVASSVAHAQLIHVYDLNGNLNDSLGGPSLVAEGGTIGASSYAFGSNQGLTLLNPGLTNPGEYSIEMRVKLDAVRGFSGSRWVKLIDYKNLASDNGLYSFDGDGNPAGSILQFYPVGGTDDAFFPNQYTHVVITRDAATKQVITYGQGYGVFSFTDFNNDAVFTASGNIMRFLQDDYPTSRIEANGGEIDYIKVYDSVLSAREVETTANVPDGGSTLAFLGLAFGMVAAVRRRFSRS